MVEAVPKSEPELKDDDLLSEISTPDIDFNERRKLLDALSRREKDIEELELENCFNQLVGKAKETGNDLNPGNQRQL